MFSNILLFVSPRSFSALHELYASSSQLKLNLINIYIYKQARRGRYMWLQTIARACFSYSILPIIFRVADASSTAEIKPIPFN
jgi:hypothetical protein